MCQKTLFTLYMPATRIKDYNIQKQIMIYVVFILASIALPLITFWIVCAFYLSVDAFGFPAWVIKYKVQPDEKVN